MKRRRNKPTKKYPRPTFAIYFCRQFTQHEGDKCAIVHAEDYVDSRLVERQTSDYISD